MNVISLSVYFGMKPLIEYIFSHLETVVLKTRLRATLIDIKKEFDIMN